MTSVTLLLAGSVIVSRLKPVTEIQRTMHDVMTTTTMAGGRVPTSSMLLFLGLCYLVATYVILLLILLFDDVTAKLPATASSLSPGDVTALHPVTDTAL